MMRRAAVVLWLGLLLTARGAAAQSFDVQQFKPVPSQQDNYFTQHGVRVLAPGQLEAGLLLNYANDPLVVVDSHDDRVGSLVGDQFAGDLLFAIGVLPHLELSLD